MRIIFLTHVLDGGGAGRSMFILIRQMRRDYPDMKIKVISLNNSSHNNNIIREYESMGVPVSIIRASSSPIHFSGSQKPNFRLFLSIVYRWRGLFKIKSAIQAFKADVVFANSYVTLLACYWLRPIPIILFAREIISSAINSTILAVVKRIIKKSIKAVICIGPKEYEQVQSFFRIPAYMVFNSANMIRDTQPDTISHQQVRNEPINYGIFGMLCPQKGQFLLVEAVADRADEFRKRNIQIHIYGGKLIQPSQIHIKKYSSAYYLRLLQDRITLLGINDLIITHGWVSDLNYVYC